MDYLATTKILKAIAEPNRLKIVDLLSSGERCACDLLDEFEFSQPTLSHHMKVLIDSGLVTARKSGKWQHYSLNLDQMSDISEVLGQLFRQTEIV